MDIRTHSLFKITISVLKTTTAIEPSSTPAPTCTRGATATAVVPPPGGLTCQQTGRIINPAAEFTILNLRPAAAVSLEDCAAQCLITNAEGEKFSNRCYGTQFVAATGGCFFIANSVAGLASRSDALIDDPTNSAILSDVACFVCR